MKAHFDTVLMIVTGRVVPSAPSKAESVKGLHNSDSMDAMQKALAVMFGRPVYTHNVLYTIPIAAAYFRHSFPEIKPDTDFPLTWSEFEDWRGSFLTEHDLFDWYDIPTLDLTEFQAITIKPGDQVAYYLESGAVVIAQVKK